MLRLSVRRALRRPAFSIVVVGLLAGAIGINATVFAVLKPVAFHRLPYPHADQLVDIRLAQRGCEYCARETIPGEIVSEWQRSVKSVNAWGVMRGVPSGLILTDSKRDVYGEAVSASTLPLLGAQAQIGRIFAETDDVVGGPHRVVLSADFWRREFAGDQGVVGRFIKLNNEAFEVVGVLDRSFVWPGVGDPPDLFVSHSSIDAHAATARVGIIARLAPGATIARLNDEIAQTGNPMVEQFLGRTSNLRTSAVPLSRMVAVSSGIELVLMQLLAVVVLGVACANVAGLLIARQESERHIIGMRAVLGARVRDLIALPLLDVAPLVIAGAALGLLLASRATPFAGPLLGITIPRWADAHVDLSVIVITLAASAIASLAIALVPAKELFRADLRSWIQTGTLATAGSKSARARQQILVGAQIGVSTTLLVVAATLVVNLVKLGPDNARLQRQGMLRAPILISADQDARDMADRILERLKAERGITAAAFTRLVAVGSGQRRLAIDGIPVGGNAKLSGIETGSRFATEPNATLLAGRDFTDAEIRAHAGNIAVINEALARSLWRDVSPLGHRIRFADDEPWRMVIGVMRNSGASTNWRVASDPAKTVATYWIPGISDGSRSMSLLITTERDADRFVTPIGRAIEDVAPHAAQMLLPDTPLVNTRAEARVRTILLAALAVFAIAMAAIGIGTLVAFSTGLRSREFGIRTAMGATARMIAAEVAKDALQLSGKGLLLGAVGTVGAYFAFIPMLYFNAKVFDWRIAIGAMAMMTALIVGASLLPAIRAARLNPANVLRGE